MKYQHKRVRICARAATEEFKARLRPFNNAYNICSPPLLSHTHMRQPPRHPPESSDHHACVIHCWPLEILTLAVSSFLLAASTLGPQARPGLSFPAQVGAILLRKQAKSSLPCPDQVQLSSAPRLWRRADCTTRVVLNDHCAITYLRTDVYCIPTGPMLSYSQI